MKKISLLLFCLLLFGIVSIQAAPKSVGVVIIGTSDFRTPDYYNILTDKLPKLFTPSNYSLSIGTESQNRYQAYWNNKGFLTEQTATKADLLDFANQSNYDNVLFLILSQPIVDTHKVILRRNSTRVSLDVCAIYIDAKQKTIISNVMTTQEDDSKTSQLRAKSGAFGKATDFFVTNIKGI